MVHLYSKQPAPCQCADPTELFQIPSSLGLIRHQDYLQSREMLLSLQHVQIGVAQPVQPEIAPGINRDLGFLEKS